MSNNKWMDDPVLEGISNEKLEMLTKIIEGAKGMEPKQMLTYFIQQSNAAGKQGINFTNSETDLILNVLKEGMTPEEIKRMSARTTAPPPRTVSGSAWCWTPSRRPAPA